MEQSEHPTNDQDLIRITGEDRTYVFHGALITDVTTEASTLPRWTEIELYRFTDGTARYLVHIIGRSVIYHRSGSVCNSGVPTPMFDLTEDAEPCPRCRPPKYVDSDQDDIVVDVESDRHTVAVCATVPEVFNALKVPGRVGFTAPAQRLIDRAKLADPVFAAATRTVEIL